MALQKDFDKFLSDIEPSSSTKSDISRYHRTLRSYLESHERYGAHCISTFLSGSYARNTMIRPVLHDGKRDVDIDVVTDYGLEDSSAEVLEELEEVLGERKAYGKLRAQDHSVGIEMEGMGIDVVPLVEDSVGNLYVASRESDQWMRTDPKGHKQWSTETNESFGGAFKPLVKAFKWWRRVNVGEEKYPKGITLEKIIADCLPEEHDSTEQDFLLTMQTIIDEYSDTVDRGRVPFIQDPTLPSNDLAEGYSCSDFRAFLDKLKDHLDLLEDEGLSNATWRKVLGDRFPSGLSPSSKMLVVSGYEVGPVLHAGHKMRPESQWSMQRGQKARIVAEVRYPTGLVTPLTSGSVILPKGCSIDFKALYSSNLRRCRVYWQVVNTGAEAAADAGGLRGGFDESNIRPRGRHEETKYLGAHSIQCYVVKGTICVAQSDPFFVFIE